MYGSDAAERTVRERVGAAARGSSRPSGATSLGWAPASAGRRYTTAHYRRRLPWLLAALALHGLLFALFLLPKRARPTMTPPEPIQTQIISEPHVTPAPPPLKPVALTLTQMKIVVPAPLVSIPDPSAIPTTSQAAPSAAVMAAPASAPGAPPERISPPQFDAAYLHNPAPEYPLQARRLHEQGTVLLRVEVSAAGGVLQVSIEHGSGWPALDTAAAAAVKRWRFGPARRGSDPVAAWVLVPIEFHLRR